MELHKKFYTRYILLEKTLVQFVCIYLTRGSCNSVISKILLTVILRLVVNGIAQNFLHKIHTIRRKLVQFVYTYFAREHCYCVFSKIHLIVISQFLFHGIAQNFISNIRTARDDIYVISVIIPYQGALQLRFFENSCDSHNMASIA